MATHPRVPNLWNLFQAAWAEANGEREPESRKQNLYNAFASLWFARMPRMPAETDSEYRRRMCSDYRRFLPRILAVKRAEALARERGRIREALIAWEREFVKLGGNLYV